MTKHARRPFILGLLVSIFALIVMLSYGIDSAKGLTGSSSGVIKRDADCGIMPLFFIPNQGQFDERVKSTVQSKDLSIYFTSQGQTFVLTGQVGASPSPGPRTHYEIYPQKPGLMASQKRWVVKLEFVGANHNAPPESLEQTETVASYFKGAEGMKDQPAGQSQDHLPRSVAGHRSFLQRNGESPEVRRYRPPMSRTSADLVG